MSPEIYFRMALLMRSRDLLSSACSIPEFIAQGDGEILKNIGAGGFIYLLSESIDAVAKSGGGGSIPFVVARSNKGLRR